MFLPLFENCTVAVIGLGYVGLPISFEIAKQQRCNKTNKKLSRNVIGFDIDEQRIAELKLCEDRTKELSKAELLRIKNLKFTSEINDLLTADIFIITVPTPIDDSNQPDINPIISATRTIAEVISKRKTLTSPIIIYESTVYPGLTEELCVPIIESVTGLKYNKSNDKKTFYCGYSPERINPGDKSHKISNIIKVTSGSNQEVANWIDSFYGSFIEAKTYKAKSIKIAEAAKVIENTQRDLNIALINELAIIFNHMEIDTEDVLKAAETKWNFIAFRPGLVGGHCIGVDPYYLTYKSEKLGYSPQVVLSGRRINDYMSKWVVEQIILIMAKKGILILNSKVLILGFTFKEDCPDIRNTKVFDINNNLKGFGINTKIVDPLANKQEVKKTYDLDINNKIDFSCKYSAVILAVGHTYFKELKTHQWKQLIDDKGFFFDLKYIIPRNLNPERI